MKTTYLAAFIGATALICQSGIALGVEIDLTTNGDFSLHTVNADYGGTGLVGNWVTQPAGTGVFEPFLTIQSPGSAKTESGYNTNGVLYLDQQRPHWNTLLTLGQLAVINVGGTGYFVFELDSNEPGNNTSLISVDNVRIYTSASDNTAAVGSVEGNLDLLGIKRWAMNDPLKTGDAYNIDEWIKLDSNQVQGNGGSGISDMQLYVPVTAFAGAKSTDYVWFYNLNGVHYDADKDLASTAGYEEWRARVNTTSTSVPDGGATAALLGFGIVGIGALSRRFNALKA